MTVPFYLFYFYFFSCSNSSKQARSWVAFIFLTIQLFIYFFPSKFFYCIYSLHLFFFFFRRGEGWSVVVLSVEHVSAAPALDFLATTRQARKTKIIVQARCVVGLQKGGEGRGGGRGGCEWGWCVWEGEGGRACKPIESGSLEKTKKILQAVSQSASRTQQEIDVGGW